MIQGTTFYKKVTLKTADTGELLDLTGYSARGQIRVSADSPIKLVDIECTIPVPTNGEIFLYISVKNTAATEQWVCFTLAIYSLSTFIPKIYFF